MMSGIVKYVVVGSISVLVATNAAFGMIESVGALDLSLIFLGGLGAGAAAAGLLYRIGRIRRRRRELERARRGNSGRYDGMADPVA